MEIDNVINDRINSYKCQNYRYYYDLIATFKHSTHIKCQDDNKTD